VSDETRRTVTLTVVTAGASLLACHFYAHPVVMPLCMHVQWKVSICRANAVMLLLFLCCCMCRAISIDGRMVVSHTYTVISLA
jgi:hypothetical protein